MSARFQRKISLSFLTRITTTSITTHHTTWVTPSPKSQMVNMEWMRMLAKDFFTGSLLSPKAAEALEEPLANTLIRKKPQPRKPRMNPGLLKLRVISPMYSPR